MITRYTAPSAANFARARNAAHKNGLPFERIPNTLSAEVTFQDPTKVLSIVKEAGGTIGVVLASREMTRAEML